MRSLDGQDGSVDDGLVALLIEAECGNLGQQVVEPRAWSGVRVCANHSYVASTIYCILTPHGGETLEYASADGGVAKGNVEKQVDEAVLGLANVANDESSRVNPLAQASADLRQIGISGEANLNDRSGDVGLADTEQILVTTGLLPGLSVWGHLEALMTLVRAPSRLRKGRFPGG